MDEESIQRIALTTVASLYPEIVILLSLSGIPLLGTPKQKAQIINKLKQGQFRKGIPDVTLALPEGKTLHLEYKTDKGVQSASQKEVSKALSKIGHSYYIIRSTEQTFSAIAEQTTLAYRQLMYDQFGSKLPLPVKPYYHL